ncbi:MAG: hypothetical protein E7585_06310 [Ruminococcaceae bacterium]|nr:hypothetical protein [Oscillospiraceae bacterium]
MLKGFKVIKVLGNASESTVSITPKYFKFNADTATELGNPQFIKFWMNADTKSFAITPCAADDEDAAKFFSKPSTSGKRAVINVAFKPAHSAIVRLMAWQDSEFTHKVPGIFVAEENAIVYDLTRATEYGGKGTKEDNED